ncbi:MAG: hypothetical protein NT150_14100 [Bacteroidetes bacterium]|nr:hypothetical protein [Bacteroidota bacterium]
MKMRLLSLLLSLYSCVALAFTPAMYTYTTSEYEVHQENYSAVFDGNGLLYVANAYAVLEYDGYEWKKIPLPDGKSPVSLCYFDNKVFIGGNDEFGYISRNATGISTYHSLVHLVPDGDKKQIGWLDHCVEANGKIYFGNSTSIFIYDGTAVTVMKPSKSGKFLDIENQGGQIHLFEKGRGLGVFDNTNIEWMAGNIAHLDIIGIEKVSSKLYYLYASDGVYKFDGLHAERMEKTAFLSKQVLTHVIADGSKKVLCTELGGVYILDDQFDLKFHFDQTNSQLTTNYVYAAAENKQGDLCFATANGITLLNLSSSVTNVDISSALYGAGYSSLLVGDTMYLGTSQGLFFAPHWKAKGEKKFEKIPEVKAYVYDIHLQNGALFCGNRAEVYQIKGTQVKVLSPESGRGAWGFHSVPNMKDVFLVGTYTGIDVYKFENGAWKFSNKLEGYNCPGRNFEFDSEGNIWVASGLAGLFKISVDKGYSKVLKSEEFCEKFKHKKDYFIELIKSGNTILISSYDGIYKVENGTLKKDEQLNALGLPFERIRKINDNLIYTVQKRMPVVLQKTDEGFVIDSAHILNNIRVELIGNSELIDQFSHQEYIVGTPDGFIIANNASSKQYYGKISFRKIQNIFSDSLISTENPLSFDNNNIRFTFSYSPLERFYSLEWYAMLEEDGKGVWQKIDKTHFKEFSNLKEGDYTFRLKVVCRYTTLDETAVSFTILPPWYRTTLAKVIYFLLIVALAYFIFRYNRLRMQKLEIKMTEEKQKELMVQEKEFKAELLKKELQEKETEMSYMALNYSQKKDLLEHVSDKMNDLLTKLDDPRALRAEIKGLEYSLNTSEGDEEKKWNEFQILFNKEHNDYLDKIKAMDPKIKESMLLMCVYIRMGKSNKDICNLINISITALDKRKSRLREKFNVAEDVTLNEFLRLL